VVSDVTVSATFDVDHVVAVAVGDGDVAEHDPV
jgi:hypothetical protein